MKIRFVFKRRRTTRRTTTTVKCGTAMYGALCVTQGQGYLLRETNTQTCAHPLCTMQHNNARLSFLSFVTHFRDTDRDTDTVFN